MGMTVHWTGPHGVHIQVRGRLSFLNGILVKAVTEIQHRKQTTSCPLGDLLLNEGKGVQIRLRFSVKIAKTNNHSPPIYGVLICRWRLRNCKWCTAPLAGHTTLKPTQFPEICFNYISENLMFLSMVLLGVLFLRLVPLTKLDEGFTKLPTDRGVLD